MYGHVSFPQFNTRVVGKQGGAYLGVRGSSRGSAGLSREGTCSSNCLPASKFSYAVTTVSRGMSKNSVEPLNFFLGV